MRVCHVITCLGTGGAQSMLKQLVTQSAGYGIESEVVALTPTTAERIEEFGRSGATVTTLRCGWSRPCAVGRLTRHLRRRRPDIVQTWLYHADLLGGLAARANGIPVVWNLRHSGLMPGVDKWTTRWTMRICGALGSWLPAAVVVNSRAGMVAHRPFGYRQFRWIPNAIDLAQFKPQSDAPDRLRRQLGVRPDTRLVGLIARWHPMKGHARFLAAMRRVCDRSPVVRAVLAGTGICADNRPLMEMIRRLGLTNRCHLLGERNDTAPVHAALDVAVSASIAGEGFSNTLAEAMACGVPCVATDVGDSGLLVGRHGIVVPANDARALADASWKLLELPAANRRTIGEQARRQVATHYRPERIARRYVDLWRQVLAGGSQETEAESYTKPLSRQVA